MAKAALPRKLCTGLWILRQHKPAFVRLPREELRPVIAQWPLEGPQSWDERKVARIARAPPLPGAAPVTHQPQQHAVSVPTRRLSAAMRSSDAVDLAARPLAAPLRRARP